MMERSLVNRKKKMTKIKNFKEKINTSEILKMALPCQVKERKKHVYKT
jgi:hypothetical protein